MERIKGHLRPHEQKYKSPQEEKQESQDGSLFQQCLGATFQRNIEKAELEQRTDQDGRSTRSISRKKFWRDLSWAEIWDRSVIAKGLLEEEVGIP